MGVDTRKGQYKAYRQRMSCLTPSSSFSTMCLGRLAIHHLLQLRNRMLSGTPQGSTMERSRVASFLLHRGHPLLQLMTMMMSMMKRKGTGMTTTRMRRSDLQGH